VLDLGVPVFLELAGSWMWPGGSPSSAAAGVCCVLATSRSWEEAPQPLGGSVAAATSSPALRSGAPAWRGLWLQIRLALRLVPGPQRRCPPGLRSIAASRLRPPAGAHLPAWPAAPPSGSRAAVRPFVRPARRAPLRTRTPPARPPAAPSRRAPRAQILPAPREQLGAPTRLPATLGPSARGLPLHPPTPPLLFSRSEPPRGRERG
jgi:hypothetical protein